MIKGHTETSLVLGRSHAQWVGPQAVETFNPSDTRDLVIHSSLEVSLVSGFVSHYCTFIGSLQRLHVAGSLRTSFLAKVVPFGLSIQ